MARTRRRCSRARYLGALLVSGAGLGGMLAFSGLKIPIDAVVDGPGGNDLSASARSLTSERLQLRRDPIVR